MKPNRIDQETSRRVDDPTVASTPTTASTGDAPGSIDFDAERLASTRLRQALTPPFEDLHELQRRLQVALEHLDASEREADEDAIAGSGKRIVRLPRWSLIAGAAASFLLGAISWWIVFRPAPDLRESVPELAAGGLDSQARMIVLEGEEHVLEPLPVSSAARDAPDEVGVSRWIRRQQALLKPDLDAAPADVRSSARPAREIFLELEQVETRSVRYVPRPWQ